MEGKAEEEKVWETCKLGLAESPPFEGDKGGVLHLDNHIRAVEPIKVV